MRRRRRAQPFQQKSIKPQLPFSDFRLPISTSFLGSLRGNTENEGVMTAKKLRMCMLHVAVLICRPCSPPAQRLGISPPQEIFTLPHYGATDLSNPNSTYVVLGISRPLWLCPARLHESDSLFTHTTRQRPTSLTSSNTPFTQRLLSSSAVLRQAMK